MKRFIAVILLAVFSLVLVACGGDRGSDVKDRLVDWYELAEDADYDGSKVTITFWHRMGQANQEMVQKWIREFNEIYPNITVVEEKAAASYDALADKISLSITAGNYPDIAESYPDHIARYAMAEKPLALNNFINHPILGYTEDEVSDFLSGLWAEGSSYDNAGTILSLPFTKSSEALFYNATYFEEHGYEVPTTWDEVFAIAEDIKKREPDAIPVGYDSEDNLFITASEQWKAPYTGYNVETGRGEVLFNNAESKEMAKYFKSKVDAGLMIRSEEHTSELQSRPHLVCRLLLEKKKKNTYPTFNVYFSLLTSCIVATFNHSCISPGTSISVSSLSAARATLKPSTRMARSSFCLK